MRIEEQDYDINEVTVPPNLYDDVKDTIKLNRETIESDQSEDEERPGDFNYDTISLGRLSNGSPPAKKEGETIENTADQNNNTEGNQKPTIEGARTQGNTPKPMGINSKRLRALNQNSKSIEAAAARFRRSPGVGNNSLERDQVSI